MKNMMQLYIMDILNEVAQTYQKPVKLIFEGGPYGGFVIEVGDFRYDCTYTMLNEDGLAIAIAHTKRVLAEKHAANWAKE